jgi:type IV secretion system protein VirB9
MRYVPYDADQVVRLSTAVGATLVVSFASDETVTAVAETDSKDLRAMPRGNYLFLKSSKALSPQPVIVLTSGEHGTRRYVFNISTFNTTTMGPDNPNIYYSVQFTYPADVAARHEQEAAARAAAWRRRRQKLLAAAAIERARAELNDPFIGKRNWHYVAQGDRSLLPLEVFDNGYATVFRFPGNVRIPAIFMLNPDGKEATANYAVKGDMVTVGSVARGWRLRDGNTVLCIWNQAYDPVGDKPNTGTISPNVERVMKGPPQ